MLYAFIKIAVSAALIVIISEVSKRSTFAGATLAALPFTSILAMTWLYLDTRDTDRVAHLSTGIFWMVLPTLVFFLILPPLLKLRWNFFVTLAAAFAFVLPVYFLSIAVAKKLGAAL